MGVGFQTTPHHGVGIVIDSRTNHSNIHEMGDTCDSDEY
jgi:hypothetical protein